MQGPSSYDIVTQITVIAGQPGSGVFIYDAAPGVGTLIAAAVGAAGTDPTGQNTVAPVLSVGQWSAITGLPGAQSMVDKFGNLAVVGSDGQPRMKIWTGADGISNHNPGAVWWLNDFGAVVQVIDPVKLGTFQYVDTGSATQGGLIGSLMSRTTDTTDPINGATVHPGITIIDPVFGDNLSIQGDVVGFDQVSMTRKCFISSQDPAGATNAPFLQVDAPEHTSALHWQGLYFGQTQDGTTHPPKAIFCTQTGNGNPPVINTNDFLELQPVSGQDAFCAFLGASAGQSGFNLKVSGDTFNRFSVDGTPKITFGPGNTAQDVNLYRIVVSSTGILRTDNNMEIGGTLNIPQNGGAHVGIDTTGHLYLFNATPTGTILSTENNSFRAQLNAGNAFVGHVQLAQVADVTARTVTQTVATQISGTFTMPINDAIVPGIVYRVEIRGSGTQGTTAQNLFIGFLLDGSNIYDIEIPSTALPISVTFAWEAVLEVIILTTGAGGTADYRGKASVGFGASATPGALGMNDREAQAFNTTASHTLAVSAHWGANVGAPTITGRQSWFERKN